MCKNEACAMQMRNTYTEIDLAGFKLLNVYCLHIGESCR